MRAYPQVLELSVCAVVGLGEIFLWVITGYNIIDLDFRSIWPPHGNIVAQVDVSTVVKPVALSLIFEFLRQESFQHLQDMRHLIQG